MKTIIEFPTDLVRAEAELDRAHARWLANQKRYYSTVKYDITIMMDAVNHVDTRCTHFNLELMFETDYKTGKHRGIRYPSFDNLLNGE